MRAPSTVWHPPPRYDGAWGPAPRGQHHALKPPTSERWAKWTSFLYKWPVFGTHLLQKKIDTLVSQNVTLLQMHLGWRHTGVGWAPNPNYKFGHKNTGRMTNEEGRNWGDASKIQGMPKVSSRPPGDPGKHRADSPSRPLGEPVSQHLGFGLPACSPPTPRLQSVVLRNERRLLTFNHGICHSLIAGIQPLPSRTVERWRQWQSTLRSHLVHPRLWHTRNENPKCHMSHPKSDSWLVAVPSLEPPCSVSWGSRALKVGLDRQCPLRLRMAMPS